ncbi:hypothetical protein Z043_105085 [Scleropages formosus]|uniref:Uncharacterized protein n=1 Tax=Scleropages formosus TaxID=113540 RepID=A0A0P7V3G7_SCLFO|nr:hypothetical protein Z043_105085 [Scleropages formosus]
MEARSQASSAAEKKKRVESIVATKGSSSRTDVSEKAVASSTTSNGFGFGWLGTEFPCNGRSSVGHREQRIKGQRGHGCHP